MNEYLLGLFFLIISLISSKFESVRAFAKKVGFLSEVLSCFVSTSCFPSFTLGVSDALLFVSQSSHSTSFCFFFFSKPVILRRKKPYLHFPFGVFDFPFSYPVCLICLLFFLHFLQYLHLPLFLGFQYTKNLPIAITSFLYFCTRK